MKRSSINLLPWQSAHTDNQEKSYYRVGSSLYEPQSAVQGLSNAAFRVYHYMQNACAGKRDFTFPRAYYEKRGFSSNTVDRAVKELEAKGFLKVTRYYKRGKPNTYQWDTEFKWRL